jgi:hypothetical protein
MRKLINLCEDQNNHPELDNELVNLNEDKKELYGNLKDQPEIIKNT